MQGISLVLAGGGIKSRTRTGTSIALNIAVPYPSSQIFNNIEANLMRYQSLLRTFCARNQDPRIKDNTVVH